MNITVAVGLITAGSTLAGGLIASVTSLKIQAKQLREQNVLLKAERQERQNSERRSIRRDAYTEFLNQMDKTDDLIDIWWPDAASFKYEFVKSEGDITDVTKAMTALDNLANIVSLEGPEGPELAAKNAMEAFKRSFLYLTS
jgi:LPS O-antigen subunit length determinant protein (WzzB/FepE family)